MPASSSFPSDGRGKWKRRKRDPHISRKPSKQRDDDDDDEDDAVPDDDTNNINNNSNTNTNNMNNQDDSEEQPQPADPNPFDIEIIPQGGIPLCDFPSVIQRSVSRPHASVLAVVAIERANSRGETSNRGQVLNLENVSYGQLQAVSAVPREGSESDGGSSSGGGGGGGGGCVVMPPAIMEGKGVVKRFGNRVLVVPMHSDWFSPATVHRLERQVVPHFFSGKSPDHTPEKYMECRNYIVAKYMENPEIRLSVADCQELVAGIDNEDLTRIVRFLDHWGIINYCAAPPRRESWNSQSYLREDPTGEIHVPSTALKSIDSLIKFDKPICRLKAIDIYSSLSGHDDDSSDLDTKIRERLTENYCNCCSQPLPVIYYQSQKEVDVMLCLNCFHEGRFVSGHSSLDFVKLDAMKDCGALDGDSWNDQETLLLLEAVEIYNENWNEIAEHVGTKSKAQCILHFLRLPMEDSLLDGVEVPCATKPSNALVKDTDGITHASSNGSCIQEADSESRLPFSNSGNPVMALVTFLASAVGPRVAAACAHASLAALSEDSRMNSGRSLGSEGNIHGETSNSNQQKEDRMQNTWGRNETSNVSLSAEKVKEAAKVGLAAAATKAKLFADHEEREIQRLSANIINHQLKRLELKLKQFAEVEAFLMRECEQVEKARQRSTAERNRILSSRVGASGSTSQMNLAGIASSMVNNNIGNNRPQVMPPSSSQPSVSGYGSTQQIHPHMSFMQRSQGQMMFPLGPRLPLSAIQPSSSTQPNVMFNAAAGNSQPGVSQILRQLSGPGNGLG